MCRVGVKIFTGTLVMSSVPKKKPGMGRVGGLVKVFFSPKLREAG